MHQEANRLPKKDEILRAAMDAILRNPFGEYAARMKWTSHSQRQAMCDRIRSRLEVALSAYSDVVDNNIGSNKEHFGTMRQNGSVVKSEAGGYLQPPPPPLPRPLVTEAASLLPSVTREEAMNMANQNQQEVTSTVKHRDDEVTTIKLEDEEAAAVEGAAAVAHSDAGDVDRPSGAIMGKVSFVDQLHAAKRKLQEQKRNTPNPTSYSGSSALPVLFVHENRPLMASSSSEAPHPAPPLLFLQGAVVSTSHESEEDQKRQQRIRPRQWNDDDDDDDNENFDVYIPDVVRPPAAATRARRLEGDGGGSGSNSLRGSASSAVVAADADNEERGGEGGENSVKHPSQMTKDEYLQQFKRAPRRGEIGVTAEHVAAAEALGYVMSGSRNKANDMYVDRIQRQLHEKQAAQLRLQFLQESDRRTEAAAKDYFLSLLEGGAAPAAAANSGMSIS